MSPRRRRPDWLRRALRAPLPASAIGPILAVIRRRMPEWDPTVVTRVAGRRRRDPFRILVACLLSLRTKDETTLPASNRLFRLAHTPEAMLRLTPRQIERAIFPVGFYRTKARVILGVCRDLLKRFGGKVPDDLDALLTLKGVGRKTANLVVTMAFGKAGICVDTHVHRVSNRLGYVRTKTPEKTEMALREKLPRRYWIEYNDLLVSFGQNICTPLSPFCSRCPVESQCAKVGVTRHR